LSDEAYARRLQAEEDARASAGPGQYGNRAGASDDYYRQSQGTGVQAGPAPPLGGGVYNQSMPVNESKSKGLLGKSMGGGHSQPHPQAQYAPQQGYYQQQGGCKLVLFLTLGSDFCSLVFYLVRFSLDSSLFGSWGGLVEGRVMRRT